MKMSVSCLSVKTWQPSDLLCPVRRTQLVVCDNVRFPRCFCGLRKVISCIAGSEENLRDKHDRYDELQALILSAPYGPKTKSVASSTQSPTLLEREVLAMEAFATDFPRRKKSVAANQLLDLLECKGVPPVYAFEFLRHATELINELVLLASKDEDESVAFADPTARVYQNGAEDTLEGTDTFKDSQSSLTKTVEEHASSGLPAQNVVNSSQGQHGTMYKWNCSFASRISLLAEQAGVPRLVYYFYMLNVKAFDVPRLLPYVDQRIDTVMAKVEFLRTLGVKASHLPGVLARWPQLFQYECDQLAMVEEFLKGLGLSQKEIGAFVRKHPEILGQDVEKDLKPTVNFLKDLGLPVIDVKKLVTRHPVLILEGAEKSLSPLIEYLVSIGVKRSHVGALLVRRPMLVASDVKKDLWPVGDYLKKLNASADDIDKIITSFPHLFRYDLGQDFQPAVLQLESLGVDPIFMGKLLRRHPQLLNNRLNFESKTNFLLNLGLERKDLGKVIYNAPQLLGLSVDDKMQPAIEFLESLGITRSSLLKIIKRKPMVLAYNIETKLQPNTEFLEKLGIDRSAIARLVTRHPQLLILSVEKNLEPTVMYLMQLGFTR
ncbi:hypothetical protein KP509_07G062300 [Ceratopteris richardii]|nr:hypothetical protein KP509_07G062300 [Ceratopteris richardii]